MIRSANVDHSGDRHALRAEAAGDPDLRHAVFDAGASAFVRKEMMTDDLPAAIEAVLAGGTYCSAFDMAP